MKKIVQRFCGGIGLLAVSLGGVVKADNEPIRFALLQDFTAVYTFLTDEYHQGQRDYLTLINQQGGIDGHLIEPIVRDTGNEPQRGLEAYSRARREGAVLVDFLSTPVSRAAVSRVLDDEVVMITALHGRGDASDGETFPFVFPMMATYWSQAANLMAYINEHQGGLEGKKIAFVYIDTPFGREPIPVLREIAEIEGFQLRTFPYPTPGTEQSATWSDVRRFRPNHTVIWGAGSGQAVSIREAIRNRLDPSTILSVVWMSETDVERVGAERAQGVKRIEAVGSGAHHALIEALQAEVVAPGNGAGDPQNVGTTYYNIGAATMAVAVEAARIALDEFGAPLTGDKLRRGFEMIDGFTADGLMAPVTLTERDHQGGGLGRVSQWNGERWEPQTGWFSAYQEIVWKEIEKDAAGFRAETQ